MNISLLHTKEFLYDKLSSVLSQFLESHPLINKLLYILNFSFICWIFSIYLKNWNIVFPPSGYSIFTVFSSKGLLLKTLSFSSYSLMPPCSITLHTIQLLCSFKALTVLFSTLFPSSSLSDGQTHDYAQIH